MYCILSSYPPGSHTSCCCCTVLFRWGSISPQSRAFPQAFLPGRPTFSSATTACAHCAASEPFREWSVSRFHTTSCAGRRTSALWRLWRAWSRYRWRETPCAVRRTTGRTWSRLRRRASRRWTVERCACMCCYLSLGDCCSLFVGSGCRCAFLFVNNRLVTRCCYHIRITSCPSCFLCLLARSFVVFALTLMFLPQRSVRYVPNPIVHQVFFFVQTQTQVAPAETSDAPAIVAAEKSAIGKTSKARCLGLLLDHMCGLLECHAELRKPLLRTGGGGGGGSGISSRLGRGAGISDGWRGVWRQRPAVAMPVYQVRV